jgi:hypothetical protein
MLGGFLIFFQEATMRRLTGFVVGVTLVLGPFAASGEKDKVHTVGKEGLKVDGKVTTDDPRVTFKLEFEGKELDLPMHSKLYRVKLQAGKQYTITLDAAQKTWDPFLVIQNPDGKTVAFDDDGGEGLNSRLSYKPTKEGDYKVYAAALRGTGAYTLKITEAATQKEQAVGKDGLKIKGKLTNDVRSIIYPVKLEEGKTYRITLRSAAFDSLLILNGPDGKKLAEDDDSGGNLDSQIVHRAATAGTYQIVATSLGMDERGDFVLEVREQE